MAVSISSKSVKLRVRRGRVEVLAPPYQPAPYNPNVISAADMRILASAALGRRVNWEDCLAGFAAPGLAATTEGCDHADKWNSPPGTSI